MPEKSQVLAMVRKRVDAGDPMAIYDLGTKYDFGEYGLVKDVTRAVELYERAAELGVKDAHYNLGVLYDQGKEVAKDMDKAFRHYETAAMYGHVDARHNLGCEEYYAGNYELALQHFLVSAKLGDDHSLAMVKKNSWAVSQPRLTMLQLFAGIRTPSKKCRVPTGTKPKHVLENRSKQCNSERDREPPSRQRTDLYTERGRPSEPMQRRGWQEERRREAAQFEDGTDVCTVESFNDLDGLDDEVDGGSDDGGDSAVMGAVGSAGAGSSMTIETSNMARRELLDMIMDSEHGGSSNGSYPRRQRRGRRQPPSSASRWSGPGLSGSFARRWGPDGDNINTGGSVNDRYEEPGRTNKEGEPALVTAGEMRKKRRRAIARRTARAALGVLVAAALSVAGIREATKGILDTVLGTPSGEEEAAVVASAATTEEDEGARRAAEMRPWARDGDLGRPDLPDDTG
ncbi:hypothetical protein THAOC_02514 [Thalassiosira oceanica]|uniref:Uncharacterized protein n=1 Tax=Thalassiosira oceanica TaxID=159749 RepID=K0TAL8_THAOC|nr:hypothetical protein THAOC_02514 [Thalassiosira oceanica]|eukprot:EJK75753.1 hypothetical protein THAOC_02514 [Thalassiosira oceanica]